MDRHQAIYRRKVLELISTQQLRKATASLELDIGDRRLRDNHVNALAKNAGIDLAAVLKLIKMGDLREVVRGLELSPEGRSKADLVDCIVADTPARSQSASPPLPSFAASQEPVQAPPNTRPLKPSAMKLAKLEEDMAGRLGDAVAEVARKVIDPALAPFKRELGDLADRLEEGIESLEGQCVELRRLMTHLLQASMHQARERVIDHTPQTVQENPSATSLDPAVEQEAAEPMKEYNPDLGGGNV